MTKNGPIPDDRTPRGYLGVSARGFLMGCADVVPGVSGGTMAFILGIYEELIESIRILGSPEFLRAVIRLRVGEVFRLFRWKFLGSLLAGIFAAVLTLAKGIEWLLENQPVYLWSFFYGLVLASIYAVAKRKTRWTPGTIGAIVVGTILAYIVVGMVPVHTPETYSFLFFSGALAICAMILPGISGSFILVLLGKYEYILGAVNDRNLIPLMVLGAGCVVGIITFAQVLSWLFKKYHDPTIAVLIGLMAGSLRKIWPWKETVEFMRDRHGEMKPLIQINIVPDLFAVETGGAVLLAVLGFVLVLVLDRLANSRGLPETA